MPSRVPFVSHIEGVVGPSVDQQSRVTVAHISPELIQHQLSTTTKTAGDATCGLVRMATAETNILYWLLHRASCLFVPYILKPIFVRKTRNCFEHSIITSFTPSQEKGRSESMLQMVRMMSSCGCFSGIGFVWKHNMATASVLSLFLASSNYKNLGTQNFLMVLFSNETTSLLLFIGSKECIGRLNFVW